MLEYSLIKQHRPRFNIRLRDDKSYPFLAVTLDEQWPRALVMRGHKRKGVRYFGPYAHAYAIRDTLDLLLRTFPIRTCSPSKFNQHARLGRPCLLFHIEKCSGPCVGEIDEMPYRQLVQELCEFLEGDTDEVIDRLADRHAGRGEGARVRAGGPAARPAGRRAAGDREAADGRRPQRGHRRHRARRRRARSGGAGVLRPQGPGGRPQGVHRRQGRGADPRRSRRPAARGAVRRRAAARCAQAGAGAGRARRPEHLRGVARATSAARRSRSGCRSAATSASCTRPSPATPRRSSPATGCGGRAITTPAHVRSPSSRTCSGCPRRPLRIECYDMAHLQGTDYVGSMVVLEDGLPNKREYRRFKVKGVPGNDDYAAMEEVLTRRLTRLPRGQGPADRRAGYPPRQVRLPAAAAARRRRQGPARRGRESRARSSASSDEIPIASLAKRFEEVFVPGNAEPVNVPRGSEALFMLQRIRDEAHRFANTSIGSSATSG